MFRPDLEPENGVRGENSSADYADGRRLGKGAVRRVVEMGFSRPYGTWMSRWVFANPALKGWAILECPYGTNSGAASAALTDVPHSGQIPEVLPVRL